MKTSNILKVFLAAFLFFASSLFASVGKISAVNGDVSIVRAAKTIKAVAGAALEEKDTLKSTKGSAAQLVFNDNTVITVGSATVFSVEEYVFNDKEPKARFNVGEGSFKAITGKIGKIAPDKFKLETKTATIGIRGTHILGSISNGILTAACVRGAITVTANIPGAPVIIVPQGQITKATIDGVEPPRPFTPGELKNLQGGLAPLASQQPQQPEGQQANGDSALPPPGITAPKPPIIDVTPPKVVSDAVNKAVLGAIDDLVNAQLQTTEAYIDSLPNTKYAQIVNTTGTRMYVPLNDAIGNGGIGYANMTNNNVYYSYFAIYNNKIESEFGYGGVSSDDFGDAMLSLSYNGIGYNSNQSYGTYSGSIGGYLKGDTGLYGKLYDYNAYKYTYLVGVPYSNIAQPYSTNYTTSVYDMVGKSASFSVSNYDTLGLLGSITPNAATDITLTWNTTPVGGFSATGLSVGSGGARYVSEDAFGTADSSGVFTTVIDPGGADYASWGYWFKQTGTSTMDFGTWVAGALSTQADVQALITANSVANYSGKVLGGVVSTGGFDMINTATSSVNLSVNFGTAYPITGNIAFTTAGGQSWNLVVDNTVSSINAATSSFGASFSSAGSSSSVGSVTGGSMSGNFYGPNAQTIGGAFNAATATHTAGGVFKANKQ